MQKKIVDLTLPISNGMWHYRAGWESRVSTLSSTAAGDASTAYRFDLCSHTGTYLETSQHKLDNDRLLDDLSPTDFVRLCKVVVLSGKAPGEVVTRNDVQAELENAGLTVEQGDSLLVSVGWGLQHRDSNYLKQSPYFSNDLVDWLCTLRLHTLAVDVPAIDHAEKPTGAVRRLFESHPEMLLLAPLVIDSNQVFTGCHTLIATPLKIASVSASLCRVLLLQEDVPSHLSLAR